MAGTKNKKPATGESKPNSPLSLASAIAQLVLMIFGIIGIATALFGDQGLLAKLGGKLTQIESFSSLLAIPLILAVIFLGYRWFEKTFAKSLSISTANLVMYAMMAVGAFYLLRYLGTGSFTGY